MTALYPKKTQKKVVFKIDRQLRELFDNSDEFKICMLDKTGDIVGWNSSAEKMTGYAPQEVMGKSYSIFTSKEKGRKNVLQKALAVALKKGSFVTDGIRVRKDGSHFWSRSIITPVKDGRGHVHFFAVITRNISNEKEVEQKKEAYIGIASHELRNPIQTLSLYSELLGQRLELDSDKQNIHMLRDMQGQTARLVTLIDDLLLVSKVDGGGMELHREEFDPTALVKQIVRDFKNMASGHTIICKGTQGLIVKADKGRMAQVFINLLSNAVKYSSLSGRILVRVTRSGKKCIISIQDFGRGIPRKEIKHLFTRYYRTEAAEAGDVAGVGLGLYISKEIIKRHRERISVKSTVGKGTTFSFTLPLSK